MGYSQEVKALVFDTSIMGSSPVAPIKYFLDCVI
jgi:hypothetical protein